MSLKVANVTTSKQLSNGSHIPEERTRSIRNINPKYLNKTSSGKVNDLNKVGDPAMRKGDRNPPQTRFIAGELTKQLAIDVNKMVNNESNFPKKQKYMIGNRLVENSIKAYELIRRANITPTTSDYFMKQRLNLARNAYAAILDVCSDLSLLPDILNFKKTDLAAFEDISRSEVAKAGNPEKPFTFVNYKDPNKERKAFINGNLELALKRELVAAGYTVPTYMFPKWFVDLSKLASESSKKTINWVKSEERRRDKLLEENKKKAKEEKNKTNDSTASK